MDGPCWARGSWLDVSLSLGLPYQFSLFTTHLPKLNISLEFS